jgi:DNA-binding XRE family transcriptional regulator
MRWVSDFEAEIEEANVLLAEAREEVEGPARAAGYLHELMEELARETEFDRVTNIIRREEDAARVLRVSPFWGGVVEQGVALARRRLDEIEQREQEDQELDRLLWRADVRARAGNKAPPPAPQPVRGLGTEEHGCGQGAKNRPRATESQLTGRHLKEWRSVLGLNQAAAAAKLGVSQGYVAKAEGIPKKELGPALHRALRRQWNIP